MAKKKGKHKNKVNLLMQRIKNQGKGLEKNNLKNISIVPSQVAAGSTCLTCP